MSSFPAKHNKKEEQVFGQQQQQQQQLFEFDDTAQAPTPRASTPDFSEYTVQRDSSGSSTERERSSAQRRSKRIKSKNKGKEREDDRVTDQPQQQPKHTPRRHGDRATSTPPAAQVASSSTMPSSRHTAKKERSSKNHSKGVGERANSDDWSEVTDPEERRRIQNRIAQRKFREKAREQKERNERDLLNQARAGSSYQVPDPANLPGDDSYELSGVPWGGVSLRFMMAKGHESVYANSRGGSGSSGYFASTATIVPPSPRSIDPASTMATNTPPVEYAGFSGDAVPVTAAAGGSFAYYGSGGSSISSGDDGGSSSRSSSDFALPDGSQLYDDTSCFYDYEA